MSISKHFIAPLVLLLSLSSSAQLTFDAGLNFGFITSQIHGDKFSGFSKFGLHGGGLVDVGFNDQSSLLLEMMYSQKGSRNAPSLANGNENVNVVKFKLDYVELPVSYRYAFSDRLSVHGGLYYAQFLRGFRSDNGNKRDLDSGLTGNDIGFQVGGQLAAGDHGFVRLRYSNSILPMRDDDITAAQAIYWNTGGYNIVLYLSYGFWF